MGCPIRPTHSARAEFDEDDLADRRSTHRIDNSIAPVLAPRPARRYETRNERRALDLTLNLPVNEAVVSQYIGVVWTGQGSRVKE
jgi:hypothetical protein